MSTTVTDAMVEAALRAWYPGEWTRFGTTARRDMRAALEAALAARETRDRDYPKIVTRFIGPSIPIRDFDWSAITDNYDGAPDAGRQFIGHGRTEEEAIADLKEQLDEAAQ